MISSSEELGTHLHNAVPYQFCVPLLMVCGCWLDLLLACTAVRLSVGPARSASSVIFHVEL